jgi:hypothetical protein
MISLCLQCCPSDTAAAMDLAKLICELEKEKRADGEFFLIYRKDCDPRLPKFFENLAGMRFTRVKACMARNHDTGWPGGSNMLAASSQMEMSILRNQGVCHHPAYLLFEPDCTPLCWDWIDQLSAEWDITEKEGKECFGHWNMPGSIPENLHQNGNGVYCVNFFDKHGFLSGAATQGWDFFYREMIIGVSRDSYSVEQYYNAPHITLEQLAGVQKHGRKPCLLHGVKDSSAREGIRQMLFGPSKAA